VTPDFLKYYNDSNIDLCAGGPTDRDELDVEDIFAELSSQIISNLARDTVEDVVRFQQHHAAKESARAKEDALDDGKAAPVEAEDEGAPNEVAVAAAMGRAEKALWADIDFGTLPSLNLLYSVAYRFRPLQNKYEYSREYLYREYLYSSTLHIFYLRLYFQMCTR
jgi:hypothetical protein